MDAVVGVLAASQTDLKLMDETAVMLSKFGIPFEQDVISAYRDPERVARYATEAESRGLYVIIVGESRSAQLPGLVAAYTILPVIGVPISAPPVSGADALAAMVHTPRGVPVATVGFDAAVNAAVLAVQIVAVADQDLRDQLAAFKQQMAEGLRL